MGQDIAFETAHGTVHGWRADPQGEPRGALVVVQEIFGVNAHMRSVADRLAAAGYVALAPAFFDPVEASVELGYDQDGFAKGRELVNALGLDRAVDIAAAAADLLKREGLAVGAVGYCWGGTVAYLANTRLGLPAVSYYGARTAALLDETLRAPMMFHFGEKDGSITAEDVAKHREKQPQAEVYVYPAGHAFNRDVDTHAHHPESAALALERTLAFFARNLS
ncbi:dienelactone hydrolase family protein [Luteimonas sp. SX5]|uniref:Dienelactone hydrolase family protein n=1 Tax=Luteimonas galliterrae TaxID=2940486 RepID=A0ABT0MEL1_9GAMM|nr:dienelactone hydrolase family protein [Luteimonas galliterrae]MCL1633292.1 dienelactone hydrolase family protein [Luteimonas galliterrae]